jgi:pimeloyl-ACP methyl ester carboxylesterase
VILVHQLSSTRDEWGRLLAKLVGRYEIIAIDVRGHGGSTRGPRGPLQWERFGPDDWDAAVADVDAAQRWLGERGFAAADCVLVGASIGGSLAVRHAAAHPPAGLVWLSPGLAYQGLDIGDAAARLRAPRLVVYSEEDGAREAVEQLDELWGGTLEAIQVAGTGHGVALIDEEPAILDLVVRFVESAGR